jgi:2-polyprenyl-6-methoxyphenol hydroxylase-like FAD-dependent oxidoreductase
MTPDAMRAERSVCCIAGGGPAGLMLGVLLLCIGDAAHAMSPVGGVGINLAIQDAVAAADLLRPG